MEAQFWIDSWDKGGFYTSFHRKDVHPYVEAHTPAAQFAGAEVLVPLCGKTNDLLHYATFARRVVGVELAEKAVLQFFEENKLDYVREGDRYTAGNITLLCRDFFELTRDDVGAVDLVYDRAALVALPLDMRLRYIAALDRLTPVGARQLLVTLEYDPTLPSAPFSIAPEEVAAYYASGYDIEHVEQPVLAKHGMVRRWGLRFLIEHGFVLTKRDDIPEELLDARIHAAVSRAVVARNSRALPPAEMNLTAAA